MAGSYDRSLTIWQKKGEEYTKELANLSNKLSIIYSLWAPDGNKFAIGTSCKSVYIGSYNHEDNFWSGLLLKPKDKNPIQSTISALAFHKSGNLLAIGSTDCSLRVVTCSLANQNVMTQADVDMSIFRKEQPIKVLMGILILSDKCCCLSRT